MDRVYNILYWLVAFTVKLILRLNGGLEVIGKENVPAEGGVLVAANHISYIDPPLVGSVVPRQATFMARKGLFEVPVLRWMIQRAAFPVDRERTRPSTIKETVKRLKMGSLIVMFPEGRRSDTGQPMEAKRGIGMVVRLSKVPVVPAAIIGADKALPIDARWFKRAKVTVVFGKPIYFDNNADDKGSNNQAVHEKISSSIMAAIGELTKSYDH